MNEFIFISSRFALSLYPIYNNVMANFHNRLSDDSSYKRDELVRKIEHAVERMSLKELEALSYDMFTKGYLDEC